MEPGNERKGRIANLTLPADPGAWEAAGFEVGDGRTSIGTVPVAFGTAWDVDIELRATDDAAPVPLAPVEHPIGAVSIDHIVLFTPSLEASIETYEDMGLRCRRVREVGEGDQLLRQAFFRLDEVVLEVVQVPEEQLKDGAPRFWGLTVTVSDIDGAVADLGPLCGTLRDAVQPGRRIATIKREAGLGLPVALITPEPTRRA
jgi:catechol 2,3-dioxygenase-like lactoylglutathione lyase family enzyme